MSWREVWLAPAQISGSPESLWELLDLDLNNPRDGRSAALLLPADRVDGFLAATFRRVPVGTEADQVDWDQAWRVWTSQA